MVQIRITEKDFNQENLLYIQTGIGEFLSNAGCSVYLCSHSGRATLTVNCSECYSEVVRGEIADKAAEIISIKYKYEYFKKQLLIGGLSETEKEILIAGLIAADLEEDKKYSFERLKCFKEIAIDGIFNFRLKPLKRKWQDVVSYIPTCFLNTQLKDFLTYLLENKTRRVYVDNGRVYDSHFRRLKRSNLLDGEEVKILREIILSNCGEVELSGEIPKDDERYLKEYYADKLYFSKSSDKYLN